MRSNVAEFERYVNAAPFDSKAEFIVRTMLEKVAMSCPIDVLIQLASCMVEVRRAELRSEAERN